MCMADIAACWRDRCAPSYRRHSWLPCRSMPACSPDGDSAHSRRYYRAARLRGAKGHFDIRTWQYGWADSLQCSADWVWDTFCIGLTRGSVLLSFLQWFGRSNVLFLILRSIPEVCRLPSPPIDKVHDSASHVRSYWSAEPSTRHQRLPSCTFSYWDVLRLQLWSHWAVPVLFLAWALADMARYPWYAWAQFQSPPHWLTWLRWPSADPLRGDSCSTSWNLNICNVNANGVPSVLDR